ncbi:MAG: aspartate aminotransferase family protein [Vicinamibacteria bacterium]
MDARPLAADHFFPRVPGGRLLEVARGEGIHLYDRDGRGFIDGASGAAVACLGHAHPRIVDAMARQAAAVAFTHSSVWISEPARELSAVLASWVPDPEARVYFTSGGSEAVETALKLARAYQVARGRDDRHRFLARDVAYHGATLGALAVTGLARRRAVYAPMLADVVRTTTSYCYRCPFGKRPDACALECATDVENAVERDAAALAGVIVEPVVGASAPGVDAPPDYFRRVAEVCRRHDVLFIADEVMSGTGRTGRRLAMEHFGVWPDVVVLSKGLSGGYAPLGAVIVSGRVFDAIRHAPPGQFVHGFTFSASPLAAAVGLEVQRVIDEEELLPHVAAMGARLRDALVPLAGGSMVGDVRGRGLLIGLDLVRDVATRAPFPPALRVAQRVFDACLEQGLIVYPCAGTLPDGTGDQILLAPPYIIRAEEVDDMAARLTRALTIAAATLPAVNPA